MAGFMVARFSLALIIALAVPASAQAFELFGVCFIGSCEKDPSDDIIDPRTYSATLVVTGFDEEANEGRIQAASELWQGQTRPVGGAAGLIARARGDYQNILAALYNEGHYSGTISIKINGREAADLTPGTEVPDQANVSMSVDTGPVYTFGRATIENQADPLDPDDQVALPQERGFVTGERARASTVRTAAALSVEAWRQEGHAKAEVVERQATALHPQQQLNVLIRLDPGPKTTIGMIDVEGTEHMDPEFVAWMTGLEPGREFDPDNLKLAKKRLERLGVFSIQKIREAETLGPGATLPLTVVVQERKVRRIGVGTTLSSSDGAGVEAYWLHRNLFGKAEQFKITGAFGGLGRSSDAEKFDYLLSATLTKPGVFSPDTDLIVSAYGKREFNETYQETGAGGSVTLKNYYSETITLSGGLFSEYSRVRDDFGVRRFHTTGFQGSVLFDNRDSKVEPTEGFYSRFEVRPLYESQFGNAAVRVEAEARAYATFDSAKRSVLAGRIKVGSFAGTSIAQAPPGQLFLAGGGSSVRGYAYKNIGVNGINGTVTGGRSLIEGSIELRQRIRKSFGVVAFADAGHVDSGILPNFSSKPRIGIGAGLRYYTGLGAIRLDVAVPLDRQANDPSFGIYAGIGQSF